MALIDCDECGKQISDKAKHCVHCGAPISIAKAIAPEVTLPPQATKTENVAPISSSSQASEIVRRQGVIQKIWTGQKEAESIAEITIENPNGTTISTGERSSREIKPFLWAIDDLVSFVEINGKAAELQKVQSSEVPSSYSAGSITQSPSSSTMPMGNDTNHRVTRNYLWYLMVLIIAAGYWIAKGTPNPALFFSGSIAKKECLRLANENKDTFLFNKNDITANDTWLKDGKRVVQLLQKNEDKRINQIMCVYGNGMVQIPSLLEQGRWR